MSDFLEHISKPTPKKYPNINIFADEPEDQNIFSQAEVVQDDPGQKILPEKPSFYQEHQNSENNEQPKAPVKPVTDSAINSVVATFGGLETLAFFYLNRNKLRKRIFGNTENYHKAEKLVYVHKNSELSDEEKLAKEQLETYTKKLEQKTSELSLKEDEKIMLKEALKDYAEIKNIALPPGLAAFMAIAAVMLPRFGDYLD